MKHLHFVVHKGVEEHALRPLDPEAEEYLDDCGAGEILAVSVRKPRNPGFHRKGFALLKVAYDLWEPNPEISARKDFESFRKQLTILAGYYRTVHRIDGSFELVAESISFNSMDDVRFARWFSDVIDVVLSHIMVGSDREEIEDRVQSVLDFA